MTYDSAAKLADDHYEFFVLTRNYVLVSQTPDSSADKTKGQGTNVSSTKQHGATSTPAVTSVPTAGTSYSSSPAHDSITTSAPKPNPGSTDQRGASGKAPATSGQHGNTSPASPTTGIDKAPPTVENLLGSALIDGKTWNAKVVPIPDNRLAFMVHGKCGFWKRTTLGITRYANTDVVSSVSSTAENLVPARIEQIASIAASIVSVGAAVAVAPPPKESVALEPFVVEVGKANSSGTINSDWTYSFEFDDSTPPADAISIDAFRAGVAGKTVGYWPVPACRPATLTLERQSSGKQYSFHVVVASPDYVRLQPLPVSGKLDLGSVCGASTSGTVASDALANVSDDFQAAQKAVQTIQGATKKPSSTSQPSGSTGK